MTPEEATAQLFEAAQHGVVKDAKAALKAGADVNARDEWRRTPMHWAADFGKTGIVKLLTDKGADALATDYHGDTPHDIAVRYTRRTTQTTLTMQINTEDLPRFLADFRQGKLAHYGITDLHIADKHAKRAPRTTQNHAHRVTDERKDKGPPQVGG